MMEKVGHYDQLTLCDTRPISAHLEVGALTEQV